MAGLRNPLRTDVELQRPASLEDAMGLAHTYERRLELDGEDGPLPAPAHAVVWPPFARSTPTPCDTVMATTAPKIGDTGAKTGDAGSTAAPVVARPAPSPRTRFSCLTPEEMTKRRLQGLCFNCPEKFSHDHIKMCTMKGIYLLELDQDAPGEEGDDEILEVSLYALTGIKTTNTMQLEVTFGNHTKPALVGSSSTHSFLAKATTQRLGLVPRIQPGLIVGVANGDHVPLCETMPISIGAETFIIDFYVIPLGGHEVMLGVHWLRTLGPILWDFERLTMAFLRTDHWVKWHGIAAGHSVSLSVVSAKDLMQLLLEEFKDLFELPHNLPPQRCHDHHTHLLPGMAPVAVRPYCYPPLLKDEIERQCRDMLE
uniref:Uncharacterized protein n=1 Tax=Arundo donax TaxID=35708 RepID=A0A0A9DMB3_ARUDO